MLSTIVRTLTMNGLLIKLEIKCFKFSAYAEDLAIPVMDKFAYFVGERMPYGLPSKSRWKSYFYQEM